MTLVLGARCNDGVVIVTDLKLTSRASGEIKLLRYEPKISGVFINVIFGYAGDVDIYDVFVNYAVGDSVRKRDDPNDVYTTNNFIQKLCDNMNKLRSILVRNKMSLFLRLMIARQFPCNGKSDLHIVDSNGKHDSVTNWGAIGDAETCATELVKGRWQPDMTMSQFAELSYSTIRYIEEKKFSEYLGLGGEKPALKYLKDGERLDTDLTDEEWKKFQGSYPNYEKFFDSLNPSACQQYI